MQVSTKTWEQPGGCWGYEVAVVQVWVRKHRQTDKSERNSAWKRVACHDSAWRSDGVNDTLYKYAEKINFINMGSCWYELIGADKLKVPYKR